MIVFKIENHSKWKLSVLMSIYVIAVWIIFIWTQISCVFRILKLIIRIASAMTWVILFLEYGWKWSCLRPKITQNLKLFILISIYVIAVWIILIWTQIWCFFRILKFIISISAMRWLILLLEYSWKWSCLRPKITQNGKYPFWSPFMLLSFEVYSFEHKSGVSS